MERRREGIIGLLESSSTINDEDYATAEEELPGRASRLEQEDQGALSDVCSTGSDHELELVGFDREHELKSKLEKSRGMLRAYAHHTTNQDGLLKHLHTQVEEYRSRCSHLEEVLRRCPCTTRTETIQEDRLYEEDPPDFQSALSALELERARCAELKQLNVVLREHLEITTETNATLTMHMERMTEDWQNATRADLANHGGGSDNSHDEYRATSEQSSIPRLRQDLQELKGDLSDMRQAFAANLASIQAALRDASDAAALSEVRLADDSDNQEEGAAGSDRPDFGLTRSEDLGLSGLFAVPPDHFAGRLTEDLNKQVEALHHENEQLHVVLASRQESIEQMSSAVEALRTAQRSLEVSVEKSSHENRALRIRETDLQLEVHGLKAASQSLHSELEAIRKEKKECANVIASLRKQVVGLEDEQQRSEREIGALRQGLLEIEKLNDSLERELQEMHDASRQLEQSNTELAKAKNDAERAREALVVERDSLARRETEVAREKARLESLLEESASRQTELETTLSARDKEIANGKAALLQLSSQKDMLSQEASGLRQSVASQQETSAQLAAQKEELAKAKARQEVDLRACLAEREDLQRDLLQRREAQEVTERELRDAREALASVRRDKDVADARLRDSTAEVKRLREKLNKLKREREADAEERDRLQTSLNHKLQEAEMELERRVAEEQRVLKAEMDKFRQEKAGQLRQLEETHMAELNLQVDLLSETESRLRSEMALQQQRLEDVRSDLQEKLATSERLRAEMQSTAEDERSLLLNSLGRCKDELSVLRRNLGSLKEETRVKMAAEQVKVVSALKQVDLLRGELEQARTLVHLKEAQEKSRESQFQKELGRAAEEKERVTQRLTESDANRTSLKRELAEALIKKAEGERHVEVLTHQLSELRQSCTSAAAETEQLRRVIGDLQQELHSTTQERDAALQEASEKFRGAEKARASLAEELRELQSVHRDVERTRQELERKVRALESALLEQGSELNSLRELSEQRALREGSAHQDALLWQQKVAASEKERDACQRACTSLARRLEDCERRAQAEREAHEGVLREAGGLARRLAQERADLEKQLLASGQEKHEVRLALSTVQGKAAALESQLKVVSESRKTIEDTLDSLLSALRSALGIQTKYELRSPSPQRPIGDHRGDLSNEGSRKEGSSFRSEGSLGRSLLRRPTPDVEAEHVLQGVNTLSRRITELEQNKDEMQAEWERSQREVARLDEELAATRSQLAKLTSANETLVADKAALQSRVSSQSEVVNELKYGARTLEWERTSLLDQLADAARRYQLKTDQCDKLQSALSRSRDSLPSPARPSASESTESRLAQLQLEGQLSRDKVDRLKLRVAECRAEMRRLEEAKQQATSQLTQLERRVEDLDHDNGRLRAEIVDMASKVKTLNDRLEGEIIKGLGVEEERRTLESRLRLAKVQLESVKSDRKRDELVINDLKGQKTTLETKLSALAVQLAECESAKQHLNRKSPRTRPEEETKSWRKMLETLREEKQHLQGEVTRLRRQLTGTIDGMVPATPDRGHSTSRRGHRSFAERDVPDGESLHSPEVSRLKRQKSTLEAKVRTLSEQLARRDQEHSEELIREHRELVAEISTLREALASHQQGRTSTPVTDQLPEFSLSLSHMPDMPDVQALLQESLYSVSENPDQLHDQAVLLSNIIDRALQPGSSLPTPSKLTPNKRNT